jgi:hypothetical protein
MGLMVDMLHGVARCANCENKTVKRVKKVKATNSQPHALPAQSRTIMSVLLDVLSTEIVHHICSYLGARSLCTTSQVCHTLYVLSYITTPPSPTQPTGLHPL